MVVHLTSSRHGFVALIATVLLCGWPAVGEPDDDTLDAGVSGCFAPTTPEELADVLVGSWSGDLFATCYLNEVVMTFGEDGSFHYQHPEQPDTCSTAPEVDWGTSWEALTPDLVMAVGPEDPAYGQPDRYAAITDIYIREVDGECTMVARGRSSLMWSNTYEAIWILVRQ